MKQSGIETFLCIIGYLVIVFGCLCGFFVFDSTESNVLFFTCIISSLILGGFLLGISQIIHQLIYSNCQREKVIDLLKKQSEQIIQKCPECGEFVIFTNGICPKCGVPLEALKK